VLQVPGDGEKGDVSQGSRSACSQNITHLAKEYFKIFIYFSGAKRQNSAESKMPGNKGSAGA
jgi:hypothetical protein